MFPRESLVRDVIARGFRARVRMEKMHYLGNMGTYLISLWKHGEKPFPSGSKVGNKLGNSGNKVGDQVTAPVAS